jgi:hypothetical protein
MTKDKSLKDIGAVIAKVVEMPEATVYERQRALVRAGLLSGDDKRGPGGGVRATPKATALLLAGILATFEGNIADIGQRTRRLMNLKNESNPRQTFGGTLIEWLSQSEELPSKIWIEASVKLGWARITFTSDATFVEANFGATERHGKGLYGHAGLYEGFHQIAQSLRS